MDVAVKAMGVLDIVASYVLITDGWWVFNVIGWIVLIKGIISLMS